MILLLKTVWWFFNKLNIELPYDLAVLFLVIYLSMNSHSNIIRGSPKMKTTQKTIN